MQKRCKQTRKGHACSVFFCAVWAMSLLGFQPVLFDFCPLLQYAMLILQSIQHSKKDSFCLPKRVLLPSKTNPFTTQKDPFQRAKGVLLELCLIARLHVSIASAPLHASCRHHEGGVE